MATCALRSLLVSGALLWYPVCARAQSFTPLPTNLGTTRTTSLSSDGRYASGNAGGSLFILDRATGSISMHALPASLTTADATGISDDGTTVVGGDGFGAFHFDTSTGFSSLPTSPGAVQVYEPTLSRDGSTAGYAQLIVQPFVTQAAVSVNGSLTVLNTPADTVFARAQSLSSDGLTAYGAVKQNTGGDQWLTRWDTASNTYEQLVQIPGTDDDPDFFVSAVTPDGSVIVGETFTPEGFGFRWTPTEGLSIYDAPIAQRLRPRAITDDGLTTVGQQRLGPGLFQAVIANETDFEPLIDMLIRDYPQLADDLGGWSLTEATGISGDGSVISGYGIDPSGIQRGWIVTIPAPTTPALLILSGLCITRRTRSYE
ncbi:MAG: hypothetical protein KDA31_02715 [Phycisphaerales bacterium]|nr:hypothetical protein [Phycisphaerales bacterium]MCB9837048.1 hypothetical protein [Phycisphaera sp.]